MLTDAQLHVWEADRPDRPWDRQHRPQLPEPFTVERAVALLDEHGVDRAVLVPPLVSGFNNDTANAYALEAVARYPGRFAVMGRFDPRPPTARRVLESWLEQPGMRGVRLSLEGPPAPQLLEEGALDWFWPAAERLGVAVYFMRPGRPQDIAAVAERHPELRIACNHLALGGVRGPEALAAHVETLRVLLPYKNVALTISALALCSQQGYPYADVFDSVRRVYDLFGTSRLAWATDYTAARGRLGDAVSYPELRDFVGVALPDLTDAERADLYDGTIRRLLRW
ncbi:MAG: amidohydrolase family protein [Chloroflexota bacterium]